MMNKETEVLKRLRQECVNVRLIFLKDVLDKQMTEEKVAKEYANKYANKYKELTEIQKCEVTIAIDKAYKYNIDAWNDEIQYAIDVMETKYYNEQD